MVRLDLRGCGGPMFGEVPLPASAWGGAAAPVSSYAFSSGAGSESAVGGGAQSSSGGTEFDEASSTLSGRRTVFPSLILSTSSIGRG